MINIENSSSFVVGLRALSESCDYVSTEAPDLVAVKNALAEAANEHSLPHHRKFYHSNVGSKTKMQPILGHCRVLLRARIQCRSWIWVHV